MYRPPPNQKKVTKMSNKGEQEMNDEVFDRIIERAVTIGEILNTTHLGTERYVRVKDVGSILSTPTPSGEDVLIKTDRSLVNGEYIRDLFKLKLDDGAECDVFHPDHHSIADVLRFASKEIGWEEVAFIVNEYLTKEDNER